MRAIARALQCGRRVVPVALVAACATFASSASAAVVFDGGPGSGPAPDTLGPYAVNPYPADARQMGTVQDAPGRSGPLTFSRAMSLRHIFDATWSSGPWAGGTFAGAVYWNFAAGPTTISLPEPQRAFYLYGQTNYFGTYAMIATAQDGTTSGEIQVTTGPGPVNARFFGFYGTGDDLISSVTISSPEADDDFAIGHFGGGNVTNGPSVEPITGDATVAEGATSAYGVAAVDSQGRPLTYQWSTSGPGSISGPADGAAAEVRVDDGPATVGLQVVVTDPDDHAATRRLAIHAANVPATARLAARNDRQVGEGQTHTYAYAIDDPGDDAIASIETGCGDGGRKVDGSDLHGGVGGSFECRFPDGPANPSVTVSATDSDGEGATPDSQPVSVHDVAPVLTFAASDTRVDEGSTRLYPYTISDPGEDAQRVVADCSTGGEMVPGSERNTATTGSFECSFPDGRASATIHAVATDSDEVLGDDDARAVAIDNVPPAITFAGGAERVVDDGQAAHVVQYAIHDPGRDVVAAVETRCGSGGEKVAGSDQHSDSAGSFTCRLAGGARAFTASARATDSDGDSGSADTQEVALGGGTSLVELASSNRRSVDEGATERSFAYAIGDRASDAITVTDTSCGAHGQKVADIRSSRSGRFRCVFREGPASTVVSVTARDAAGHTTTDTQSVTILDPLVRVVGKRMTGVENVAIAGRKVARFDDPTPYSRAGDYDATIDWGDGTERARGTIAKTGDGVFVVRGTHTYRRFDDGGYAVVVAVTDADNPANTASATSRAAIADARIHVSGADVTTLARLSGTVANFQDEGDGPVSDFTASIAWGDGQYSEGTVARAPGGTFVVSGSHAFQRSGAFDARVSVESVGGSDDGAWTDVLVYAFASSSGATFAIGDARSAPGTAVTFWGSRWSRSNALASGGATDASFAGLVSAQAGRAIPRCGDRWTTSASAAPPSDVPAFMGVVVTGALTRSGSTFAGTVRRVVVVRTDGGYRPDVLRDATGKIVAVVCG